MTIGQFFNIVELRTKIVSVSTFSIALLYSLYRTGSVPVHLALLTFFAALAVDMGTTAFNTYFDYLRRVDHISENLEEDKILVHRGVDPNRALAAATACFAAAVLLGGTIALLAGLEIAVAGALCMAVGFLYTGGPLPISSTPLGELFAGGFLGSAYFLIVFYILTGGLDPAAAAVSLPSSLMIASILSVNNACDIEGDRRAGRRTLAILIGPQNAARIIPAWGVAAIATTGLLAFRGLVPLWSLGICIMLLPAAIYRYRQMFAVGFSHATKGVSMRGISRIFMLFSLGYGGGLLVGLF